MPKKVNSKAHKNLLLDIYQDPRFKGKKAGVIHAEYERRMAGKSDPPLGIRWAQNAIRDFGKNYEDKGNSWQEEPFSLGTLIGKGFDVPSSSINALMSLLTQANIYDETFSNREARWAMKFYELPSLWNEEEARKNFVGFYINKKLIPYPEQPGFGGQWIYEHVLKEHRKNVWGLEDELQKLVLPQYTIHPDSLEKRFLREFSKMRAEKIFGITAVKQDLPWLESATSRLALIAHAYATQERLCEMTGDSFDTHHLDFIISNDHFEDKHLIDLIFDIRGQNLLDSKDAVWKEKVVYRDFMFGRAMSDSLRKQPSYWPFVDNFLRSTKGIRKGKGIGRIYEPRDEDPDPKLIGKIYASSDEDPDPTGYPEGWSVQPLISGSNAIDGFGFPPEIHIYLRFLAKYYPDALKNIDDIVEQLFYVHEKGALNFTVLMGLFSEFAGTLLKVKGAEISMLKAVDLSLEPEEPEEQKESSLTDMDKNKSPKITTKQEPGYWEKLDTDSTS